MKKQFNFRVLALATVLGVFTFNSCDDFEKYQPIGANSIEDATPPSAIFTATQESGPDEAWKNYDFANGSNSATSYSWDFGDGNTSTETDGENTYPGEGMYTVTLTAMDELGQTSTYSQTIDVVEPEVPTALLPEILEQGFEDNSLPDGSGDGRDSWRNSDLGGVIQITSDPVQSGSQAAKFPSAGDRIAYQELVISPNTDYTIKYYYTMKTNNPGSLTVAVLEGGGITDASTATTIASHVGTDQVSASDYVFVSLPFNTGANDTISIYVSNIGEECRLDNFSITAD